MKWKEAEKKTELTGMGKGILFLHGALLHLLKMKSRSQNMGKMVCLVHKGGMCPAQLLGAQDHRDSLLMETRALGGGEGRTLLRVTWGINCRVAAMLCSRSSCCGYPPVLQPPPSVTHPSGSP